jgi:hypothetical protein
MPDTTRDKIGNLLRRTAGLLSEAWIKSKSKRQELAIARNLEADCTLAAGSALHPPRGQDHQEADKTNPNLNADQDDQRGRVLADLAKKIVGDAGRQAVETRPKLDHATVALATEALAAIGQLLGISDPPTPWIENMRILILEKIGEMQDDIKGVAIDKSENDGMRGAHAFEAREDGALIIYATLPDGDGERIRIEPHRVCSVLAACGDALAKKPNTR